MNCVSCGAPLLNGAKFCTRCGTRQSQTIEQKPVLSVKKEDNSSQNSSGANNEMGIVKNKIYWNIQKGEIARHINEAEFVKYDSALGIIINDGTTAYIKSNGRLLVELKGGSYDFIPQNELNNILQTRVGGAPSWFKRSCRFISNLVFGRRVADNVTEGDDEQLKRLRTFDDVVQHMKRNETFAVALKQNREFVLTFGGEHEKVDDYASFTPMEVNTKYLDLKICVKAFFQITDFPSFSEYYLTENNVVSTNMLAKEITPLVKNVLKSVLYDAELKDNFISEPLFAQIESKMKALNFHGISMRSLAEITLDEEGLERMRCLSRELYLSEQELDALRRTNEFKNRMNTVVAEQQVYEADSELQLYNRLKEINKDKLLSEDELEKFYMVLSREKRIRQAQNNEQIEVALAEIERTGLLREEEMAVMRDQIAMRTYQRGNAVKLMQLRDAIEFEKTRTGGQQEIEMQQLLHELEIVRKTDDYKDERFYKELERQQSVRRANQEAQREELAMRNQQAEFAYNLAERGQRAQMERLKDLERLKMEKDRLNSELRMQEQQQISDNEYRKLQEQNAQEYRMQQDREVTERERMRIQQGMTAEQIMAAEIRNMDSAAQAEYARSFSAGRNADREREVAAEQRAMLERQLASQQESNNSHAEAMERMMNNMMATMATMSGNRMQEYREQRNEYKDQLYHEQQRHDAHQDIALNATTRHPNIFVQQQGYQRPSQQQQSDKNEPQGQKMYSEPNSSEEPQARNCKRCPDPDCESNHRGIEYPLVEFTCAYCGKDLI